MRWAAVSATTALAADAEETWEALRNGKSGITSIKEELTTPFLEGLELPVTIGGRLLEDFDSQLNRVEIRRLSYMQKMALLLNRLPTSMTTTLFVAAPGWKGTGPALRTSGTMTARCRSSPG